MPPRKPPSTPLASLRPGHTVRLQWRVMEGEKERLQAIEGLIIAIHRGHSEADRTMTLRRLVEGVAVERIIPLGSPLLSRVQVLREARVRRAKLTFLRDPSRTTRMKERFTEAVESPQGEEVKQELVTEKPR